MTTLLLTLALLQAPDVVLPVVEKVEAVKPRKKTRRKKKKKKLR